MQSTAASSGTAMKPAAARPSSCQASRLGSPQASPAIRVSRSPAMATGSPLSALASRHAARSGSATISAGAGRQECRVCTETAAATPPTPPWMNTWVGGAPRHWAIASSAISR